MNIFNELATAFPWHDNILKQNRYRENVADKYQDWGQITPRDALNPFQFYKTTGAATVTAWTILDLNGSVLWTMAGGSLSLIRTTTKEGRLYFYYGGAALTTTTGALNMPAGVYYSKITLSDGKFFYSELFQVPACTFSIGDITGMQFLKLEYYNDTDLRPIFYNDITGGLPYFRNIVYLDTFVHASEPEIEEDGIKDGADETVPTFQKALLRYRITELVPDYLKTALVIMQMHDHVILTTPQGLRTGEIEKLTTETAPEFNGAFGTVDILWEEALVMIKKGCGDNMT